VPKPIQETQKTYTVSVWTREGSLHPAWAAEQWTVYWSKLGALTADLAKIARSREVFKGAYAFAVHEGIVTDNTTKPILYVLEGGEIQHL
jgi:hypothetical protein